MSNDTSSDLEHELALSIAATWKPYDPCPCGCGEIHQKLSAPIKRGSRFAERHVVGCGCHHHVGKRSQRKGQAGQAKMHRRLGGTGRTPHHEETARVYPPIYVMPESKVGGRVPKNFRTFIETDWFRRALAQSEASVPVGSGVKPSVMIEGRWLIVDMGV